MRNKGQMFLITAAIIIIVLVLLRTSVNLPTILQREMELKSRFEREIFLNIVDELAKVIDISYHQSDNITNNVFDFGNFTRKKMTEKLQNFDLLYVGVKTPTSQGSDTMNVTVVNLLNKNTSIVLDLNGTIKNPFTTPKITTTEIERVDVGLYSSIAIDSGDKIHISHYNTTNDDLRYCNNTEGSWVCENVETGGDVGQYSSIALDSSDKVHMSYYNFTGRDLRYCNNTEGSWVCENVETGGDVGKYSSIALDSSDKVHMSYYNGTDQDLRYCNNTEGSWVCENVETGETGAYSTIVIDSNDKVHISHRDATGADNLRYCNNTEGSWVCENVDTTGTSGQYSSIALDSNDKVHISHEDATGHTLRYCNNTAGSWNCASIDTVANWRGTDSSIVIDSNDKVHISHHDNTDSTVRYCYTTDFSTWDCQEVESVLGAVYMLGKSLAIKKGRICTSTSFSSYIHMSYYNSSRLSYAKIAFSLEDSTSWDTNFTITQGSDYTLKIDYDDDQENVTISTEPNQSIYVGFFDIVLTGSETIYKDKFQKNYTLP